MKNIFYPFLILLIFSACGTEKPKDAAESEESAITQDANGVIRFSKKQMANIEMKIEEVKSDAMSSSITVNGHIEIPQKNKAMISSNYEGIVSKIYVEEGRPISQGQTIAVIQSPNFLAEQEEYLLVQSNIKLANSELDRQQDLYAGNAGPMKNVQRAQNELKKLQIQRAAIEQRLRMMGINPSSIAPGRLKSTFTITSPISGMLTSLDGHVGSSVGFQTPIAAVISKKDMHAVLDVYEKDKNFIYQGQQVTFYSVANPNEPYRAQVISISPDVKPETHALEVHCHINDLMDKLIEGSSIVATVNGPAQQGLIIPDEAVVDFEDQKVVFVQQAVQGEFISFKIVPVVIISKQKDKYLIQNDSMVVNKKIITKGAFMALGSITNLGEEE